MLNKVGDKELHTCLFHARMPSFPDCYSQLYLCPHTHILPETTTTVYYKTALLISSAVTKTKTSDAFFFSKSLP